MKYKLIFILILLMSLTYFGYSNTNSLLQQIIENSSFTFNADFNFSNDDIKNYSDKTTAVQIGFETSCYDFNKIPALVGFCQKFSYTQYLKQREDIFDFYKYGIMEGIFFQYKISQTFSLHAENDIGLYVTKVNAENTEHKIIDTYFNSLLFRSLLALRAKIPSKLEHSILFNIAPTIEINYEEKNNYAMFGFEAGLIFLLGE